MTVENSSGAAPFRPLQEIGPPMYGQQTETKSGSCWGTFSSVQVGLLLLVAILVIAVQALILRTYFNSSATAEQFEEASFTTTGLANIQREALLLQLETHLAIENPDANLESLELRRALLGSQLRRQQGQSANNQQIYAGLMEIKDTLNFYDESFDEVFYNPDGVDERVSEEIALTLRSLELQIKTFYDKEEQSFFAAFKETLGTQRNTQVLLLAVDALVVITGIVLIMSLVRSVRALNEENTQRQMAQVALREVNETLERRVDERTEELSTANSRLQGEVFERAQAQRELRAFTHKLEESNRELQSFASVAAHDLQEPLRKVQAFGDRLKSKYSEALGDQGRDYLERMQDASGRMASLINDLLSYSRVTTKAQPFVPVNLNDITTEVVSDLEIRIEDLKGSVEVGDLPTIYADVLQMRQLMQNLIGNALKYHKEEEAPVVKVSAKLVKATAERPGNQESEELCEITISDNGIGFDEKYADRIFGIFQRLHTRTEYDGTGVGLAICRKIAERHNGTINVHSQPDKGSQFMVTLPVSQVNEDTEEEE
ncbi:MAG: ATP-binding protein [Chloroflexi bacterium]|nr:ATP-binding protein [Chloroflexota bacterium]MDA1228857.1 ATP-binding protein [Chloroflexota bacterium]